MSGPSEIEHKGIVAWWAKNGVAANLLMVCAFIFGVMGFMRLEQEVFPQADFNGASVSISWPGASPQDVEDQIVTRLEEVLADLDGLRRMEGTAREGVGYVNLESFQDYDIDKFVDEVKLRVDQINNLPQASFPPQVQRWKQSQMYLGIAVHGNVDRLTLKRVADGLRDRIAADVEGGELAELWGTLNEEVSIEVSEDDLRRYNLTFSDVANAVRLSSINSSGGEIKTNNGNIRLQTRNLADTAEQFERIIVRQLSTGETIRVGDVANVIDGFEDASLDTTFDGEPTAFIMVMPPETMHIDKYSKNLLAFIEKANEEILPEAIRADLLFDQADMYRGTMGIISSSAFVGTVLVLIVLVLFLRPIVALWVTAGIIIAFAGGFAILPFFGVSLNILSFFAILLVIGVIVDDAIVVGENIHKEVELGRYKGVDAAIIGTQLVVKPVIFGVLTTMIMFSPWMLLPGPERQFTAQITFVVIAALSFSLIESMLILPSHLAHMKPQKFDGASGALLKLQRSIADSLLWFASNLFKPVLELAIRFRYVTVAFFVSLFMLAVGLLANNIVPAAIMPKIENDLVMANITLPDGTPFERTKRVADQLSQGVFKARAVLAERYPEIEEDIVKDASIITEERRIQSFIGALLPEKRPEGLTTEDIATAIREATGPIPDAEEVSFEFSMNGGGGGIRYALSHPDLDTLQAAVEMVKVQLATYDTTFDVGDNLSSAAPELRFELKPGAQALGVNLQMVSTQVRQAFYGEEVQRLPRDGEDVRVMVRYPEDARQSLDTLSDFRIRTPDGRSVPLNQVAEYDFAPGINRIYRRDRVRSAAVFAELTSTEVRGQIMEDMNANFWPKFERQFPTVTRGNLGDAEAEMEMMNSLVFLNLGALFMMYILLAIAFKSYFQPILLMMAVPFAFAGSVFGHLLFNIPMAMFSVFGIAAAAGVVINDNLVLIDAVNRRRDEGFGAVQALVESAVNRFRPILLTSITTFVGVLPMIAEKSVQAQMLKPMVVAMGSAVAFALFVSLLFVPALYAVGAELARIARWLWWGKPYQSIGETYDSDAVSGPSDLDDHLHHQPAE